ncbi:MAG: hypothetical protein JOZ00_02595 [Mycobacterium sp.]|uniref:hypothetical protein n=1 Tax=Mycobacterium sp. TaxID=1785 RepID=UPI001ED07E58|nr:hypothetical protein [Mycobacterium sp.]MBV8785558.1 hypothetical protein [Mycobacterium sp.]
MGNRQAKAAGALCAGVAALVVAVGWSAGDTTATTAKSNTATSSSTTPAPGGAVPVQPVGGGGCIIGLNCGCVHACHTQHPRPPDVAGDPQHAAPAPAPQNP